MPERLDCEVLQKVRNINTLTFTFYTIVWSTAERNLLKQRTHMSLAFEHLYSPLVGNVGHFPSNKFLKTVLLPDNFPPHRTFLPLLKRKFEN